MAYELLLTNATALEVEVATVEVRDAADGRVMLSLTGEDLTDQMNPIGDSAEGDGSTKIASSSTSIVWLDVSAPDQRQHPPEGSTIGLSARINTPAGAAPVRADRLAA